MAIAASFTRPIKYIDFSESREHSHQLGCNRLNDVTASATITRRGVDVADDIDFSESREHSHQLGCNRLNDVTASATITRRGVDVAYDNLFQSSQSTSTSLSARWRNIQGANHWNGLLDPIDPVLKGEILRYGDFAQACYDAFNNDTYSKYCGDCKYSRKRLLQKVGVQYAADYEVTKYLYSTSNINLLNFFHRSESTAEAWSRDLNWIGFVAVSNSASEIQRLGRREIVIAWRGTVTTPDWISDLDDWLIPAAMCPGEGFGNVKVESGFRSIYTTTNESSRHIRESAEEQLLSEIRRLLKKYDGEQLSITVTGHSLGAALALLSAYSIAESGMVMPMSQTANSPNHSLENLLPDRADGRRDIDATHESDIPITVLTFAGPRVGNDDFRDRCKELGIRTLRVVNEKDVVPKVPGVLFNENNLHVLSSSWVDKLPWTYSHVGVELALNTEDSPYLNRKFWDVPSHHNLEVYLHLVDAYHSKQKRFSYSGHRDLALVNKYSELLKSEYCIPPNWWHEENKGLQRNAEGRWVEPDREEDEDVPS